MSKPLVALLALLSLLTWRADAQNLYFRHYNNKHGLSHNTVFAACQDSRGFMWFGTEDGLNRFDGHSFKVYRHNPSDSGSVPSDRVFDIAEDSQGRLWLCTRRGLCYYDHMTDSFHRNASSQSNYCLAVRADGSGALWAIYSDRVVRYPTNTTGYEEFSGHEGAVPHCMTINRRGEPLFADRNTIYRYDTICKNLSPTRLDLPQGAAVSALCDVEGQGVLVGTSADGLMLYNSSSGHLSTLVPDIQVRTIVRSCDHTFWIGSESGVYIYDALTREITNLRKSLTDQYAIADNAVYALASDSEGGVWVGTFFGGVSYLPPTTHNFTHFVGGKTHPGMLGNAVREIVADDYGNLWLGSEDNGINRYTPATGQIVNYSADGPLSATNIHGLLADGPNLWVGTYNRGIDVVDIPSGQRVRHYSKATTRGALGSDFVLCFGKTPRGGLLVGSTVGVVEYDSRGDTFTPWHSITAPAKQIFTASDSTVYVASTEGLYVVKPCGEVSRFISDESDTASLPTNNTTSVFEDASHRIWVTTTEGFCSYDPHSGRFSRITTEHGLPGNIVYRIEQDRSGMLWISTAAGLVRFNPADRTLRAYSYVDGLQQTQFNFSSSYRSPRGTIYMGTINGMLAFDPQSFRIDSFVPPIYITGIHQPGANRHTTRLTDFSFEQTERLRLPYNEATFTLSYVAVGYTLPEAIEYAYMLEPLDKDWVAMQHNRDVTFANLAPGRYLFRVRSTNGSAEWQSNERQLEIVITPPLWATTWARGLYLLVLAGLGWLIYRYKRRRIEQSLRVREREFENRKERELYDSKIQFFTYIAHEIRTPMTLIKAPLEKIFKSGRCDEPILRQLRTVEANTDRLLELSNQLLDLRKSDSRGLRLNYLSTELGEWVGTLLATFLPMFEHEGRHFELNRCDGSMLADIDREAMTKIVSNMLTNALKYSQHSVKLDIMMHAESRTFGLVVTNDGAVIPPDDREKIFTPFFRVSHNEHLSGSGLGLSLAQALAESHGGTLSYDVTEQGLNRFTLTLPLEQQQRFSVAPCSPIEPTGSASERVDGDKLSTVLVVEDQEDMREFIVAELSPLYRTLSAADGRSGLDVLAHEAVDLIISDVMMPRMDGFELCNAVKNDVNFSHIPFVILTAEHNLQSHLRGLNTGADAYLEKPFSIDILLAQLENLLRGRRVLERLYADRPHVSVESLSGSPVDDEFLARMKRCLDDNLACESFGVESLADQMCMSSSSLYRKVKGLSGLSPVEFLRVARLKMAVELMSSGERRVGEVAFMIGFSSAAYFSSCFQKQYGCSPSEYMRRLGSREE